MARFIFPWRAHATLYVHFPCFDGVISGVLATLYLEKAHRWRFKTIEPVNYRHQREWLQMSLGRHSAVVDYLYHPQAEFWADHHPTTFLTPALRASFEANANCGCLYDRESRSCASLLWNRVGPDLDRDLRLAEMVQWAEKIDSAAYESVDEALSASHPAIILSRSLAIDADAEYCKYLIRTLRQASLEDATRSRKVQKRFVRAQELGTLGLERVRQTIHLQGEVAVYEASSEGVLMNRYSPYYFYPQAKYSIGVTHSKHASKITTMRNPWLHFDSVNLGEFMRKFGGGGHQRVGSVVLEEQRRPEANHIVSQLLSELSPQGQLRVRT